MLFYNLIGPLSRTKFIVFHQNLLFLILPFPSLVVLSPTCSEARSLCSPTPSSRLAPRAEWGLTLPILTAGNAWPVLALVPVVLCDRLFPLSPYGCLSPPHLSTPHHLILPAFPSSRSLLMLVPLRSWDALSHLPTCCNLILSCRNLHPRHPRLSICWAPGSQWNCLLAIFSVCFRCSSSYLD